MAMAASSPLLKCLLSRSLRARSITTLPPLSNAARVFADIDHQLPDIQRKHTAEAYHLLIDMPGLSKEDVKITVEENMLIVFGKGKNEFGFGEKAGGICRNYGAEIDLPPKISKVKATRAVMKNGVLKVIVPKIKVEERSDVFKVSVE